MTISDDDRIEIRIATLGDMNLMLILTWRAAVARIDIVSFLNRFAQQLERTR